MGGEGSAGGSGAWTLRPRTPEAFPYTPRMKIQAVKHILWAQDMDRAVTFWRDGIGLRVALHTPHWSELRWNEVTVALHGGGEGTYHASGLAFQVADLAEACAEAAAAGGTIRTPPTTRENEGIRLADLVDPEGNGFQLSSFLP